MSLPLLVLGTVGQVTRSRAAGTAIYTVDTTADEVDAVIDGVCRSATNHCSVRAAVMEANSTSDPVIIRIPAGVHELTLADFSEFSDAVWGDLDVAGNVTFEGLGPRGPDGRPSSVIDATGIDRVMTVTDNAVVTLQNVTLTGGVTGGAPLLAQTDGGGVLNLGHFTAIDSAIVGNLATAHRTSEGPGAEAPGHTGFVLGKADPGVGGGIAQESPYAMSLVRVDLSDNEADRGGGLAMGTAYYGNGSVTITDSRVARNVASVIGGGVWSTTTAALEVDRTFVSENTVTGVGQVGGTGGAIAHESEGSLQILSSTLRGNKARQAGGAITESNDGHIVVDGSAFTGNQANEGGAIDLNGGGSLDLTDSVLDHNVAVGKVLEDEVFDPQAGMGGAILNRSTDPMNILDVTFSANTAGDRGGAIAVLYMSAATIEHATFAGNTAPVGTGPAISTAIETSISISSSVFDDGAAACFGALLPGSHNIDAGATCASANGTSKALTPPQLGALAANGGPTRTHALLAGSPAVDAGLCTEQHADQRGVARPQGEGCDAGAYERAAGSATALAAAPTAAVAGTTVRLTATVSAKTANVGPPRGTATFREGATTLGTASVVNGVAVLDRNDLAVGEHHITVAYNGDDNLAPSSSQTVDVVVRPAPTTIAPTTLAPPPPTSPITPSPTTARPPAPPAVTTPRRRTVVPPVPLPPSTIPPTTTATVPPPPPNVSGAPTIVVKSVVGETAGPPGVGLVVEAANMQAAGCKELSIRFDEDRLATVRPGADGNARAGFLSSPGDARVGVHTVSAYCAGSPASAPPLATSTFEITRSGLHRSAFVTALHSSGQVPHGLGPTAVTVGLALVLVALIAFPAELFNRTLEEHYEEVKGWMGPLRHVAGEVKDWSTATTLGVTSFVGGFLYVLLDPGAGFSWSTLAELSGLVVCVGLVVAAGAAPAAIHLRRRYRETGRLRMLPGTFVLAAVCVLVSRIGHIQPGYLYGLIAGFVFERAVSLAENGKLAALSTGLVLFIAGGSWFTWEAFSHVAARPAPGFVVIATEAGLAALFCCGIESAVIGMIPMKFLPGEQVSKWSRPTWAVLMGTGLYACVHVLLRPGSGYVGHAAQASAAVTLIALLVASITSVSFWAYFRYRPERTGSGTGAGAHGGGEAAATA